MGLFDDHLYFTSLAGQSSLPLPGSHLLVTDEVTASANVILYHLFMGAVGSSVPIVWVDFRHETLSSFETVLRRLGTPLRSVTYIAPSPLPASLVPSTPQTPPLFNPNPTLQPTVSCIRAALSSLSSSPSSPSSPRALIVLDGLFELASLGFCPGEISRTVRAVLASAREAGASLVSTAHYSPEHATQEELVARMTRLGGAWWRVSGISPRSSDVSGEICAVDVDGEGRAPSIEKDKALQFRLEPAGVRAFPKGTGRGYL